MRNIVIDIGASSYRVMLCFFDKERASLFEIARRKTPLKEVDGFLRWDLRAMGEHIKEEVKKLLSHDGGIDSLGICSFGVDYAYLDEGGDLLDLPISYRDEKNALCAEKALAIVPQEEIYRLTGIQYLPFNTLFQLYRDKSLGRKGKLLMISDYIAYLLCGTLSNELTGLSTGALIDKDTLSISDGLLFPLGIDKGIFCPIKRPGEVIGYLKKEFGPRRIPVIAVNSHDTSSAVSALSLQGEGSAFLSCGSWALLGMKKPSFNVLDKAREANFTNELMDDGVCFLKNINGMYLINQIFRALKEKDRRLRFPASISHFLPEDDTDILLDVDDPAFQSPLGILDKLSAYLKETGQSEEGLTFVKLLNAFYRSLALRIREEKEKLEAIEGKRITRLYLVGGASRVPVFVDYLSSATKAEVAIGPSEATALGNALIQIRALTGITMGELREKEAQGYGLRAPNIGMVDRFDRDYQRFIKLKEKRK